MEVDSNASETRESIASLVASIDSLESFVDSGVFAADGPGIALARATVLLCEYKSANRIATLAVEAARARVATASTAADARARELANLEYEKAAVARELRALGAMSTPSLDALDLLPAEALGEDERAKAADDAHALMLARFDGERAARAAANAALDQSRARAAAMRARIRSKSAVLEAVPGALGKVEAASAALALLVPATP